MIKQTLTTLPHLHRPQVPSDWNYEESVAKVKQVMYKWKTLTSELATELYIAREVLSSQGLRDKSPEVKTWSDYCEDIGSSRRVVNRWLAHLSLDRDRKTPQLSGQYEIEIRHGDFRTVLADIAPHSVNIILTDPPYGKRYLPLWEALGEFASHILCPSGVLVAYSGQLYLPEIIASLSGHLQWWWLCGLIHQGRGNLTPLGQPVRKVINQFKPLVVFVPKDSLGVEVVFRDLVMGQGKEKSFHNWQQPVAEARDILKVFAEPGDLVIDPFCGSGAFGEAAKQLSMRFIGAEILDAEETAQRV